MILDMTTELRDFTYITSVYKCIASYNLRGHQIGRKIGDMLEILTMGEVYRKPNLLEHLDTEGKLEGFTTAGHKVEFGFYEDVRRKRGLFGAIECKCIGVEETTMGKGEKCLRKLHDGESFELEFNGRWMHRPAIQTIMLVSHTANTATIRLSNNQNNTSETFELAVGENIKIVVREDECLLHTTPRGNMLNEIEGIIRLLKTIKFDKVSNNVCQFSLYNCLTGPQTIEKAKQASLVAMDLRKKIDGHWGKEEVNQATKGMNFLHIICEFSHWEEKSRNVVKTCIDHNIIVPDAVVIKAFEKFEEAFGIQRMLDMISKNNFVDIQEVRTTINDVLAFFEYHVFYDIALESYVTFDFVDGKLVVIPLH